MNLSGANPEIVLGRPLAMPGIKPDGLLFAAAAGAAPDSADPVDRAASQAAAALGDIRSIEVADYTGPIAGRRYNFATVRGMSGEGATHVARGDFASVVALCGLDAEAARTARSLAQRCRQAGFRPWAIAAAQLPEGKWSLLGVIPVRASPPVRAADRGMFIFVKLWSAWLRFLHWSWALLILILIATGLEIETMYLSAGLTRSEPGFFFGYVRLVHYICGWLLAIAILARLVDAFWTRNRFEDWRSLIPVKSWQDFKNLFIGLGDYVLLRTDEGKKYLGHDPLAQLSFTFIYLVIIAAIISGFSLYGLYESGNWFFSWFAWPVQHFGGNGVRLFHVTMMWLIILFVPVHVYLVIRADGYAREGSLSSMLSGGRWIRRSAHFEDANDPELLDLRWKG